MIDVGLGGLTDRQLVPSMEMTDLLLDVRALLVSGGPALKEDAVLS